MKRGIVENKGSPDPLVDELWDIISKVRNHIKQTNCKHCRSILEEEDKSHIAISSKKHAVILESDTTRKRKQKQIAGSGSQLQNSARQDGLYYYGCKEQSK